MVKQYFTWVPFNWNNGSVHVDTHMGKNWPSVSITTKSYSGQLVGDQRHLAVVEHDLNEELQARFLNEGSPFGVRFITEAKASEYLAEWYVNGEVTIVNGEFVENFPDIE